MRRDLLNATDTPPSPVAGAIVARALNARRAAEYCALSTRTLARMRVDGGGPAFRKLSATRIAYLREDLDEWLSSRPRLRSLSDPANAAA
jgi:predicted DNA-binding transcriptional regulator AlpA